MYEHGQIYESPTPLSEWDVEWIHLGRGPMRHSTVRVDFDDGFIAAIQLSRAGILRGNTAGDCGVLLASHPDAACLRIRAQPIGADTCLLLGRRSRLDLYLPEGCTALVLAAADGELAAGSMQVHSSGAGHAALLRQYLDQLHKLRCAGSARAEREVERRLREQLRGVVPRLMRESSALPRAATPRTLRHAAVGRACAFIDLHLRDSIALADLCDAAGVCTRTLEYGFLDCYEVGPMAYLRNLRLCRVRRHLLHPTVDCNTVGAAARRWRFTHMGQFSCDYRALFGEMPSTTLTRQPRQETANSGSPAP